MIAALRSSPGPSAKAFLIPARFLTPLFVTCDVIAFFIQVVGAFFTLNNTSTAVQKRDLYMARAGLGIRIFCFGLFLLLTMRFHFVTNKIGREAL